MTLLYVRVLRGESNRDSSATCIFQLRYHLSWLGYWAIGVGWKGECIDSGDLRARLIVLKEDWRHQGRAGFGDNSFFWWWTLLTTLLFFLTRNAQVAPCYWLFHVCRKTSEHIVFKKHDIANMLLNLKSLFIVYLFLLRVKPHWPPDCTTSWLALFGLMKEKT